MGTRHLYWILSGPSFALFSTYLRRDSLHSTSFLHIYSIVVKSTEVQSPRYVEQSTEFMSTGIDSWAPEKVYKYGLWG
jgi:hypothetical protein